MKIMALLYFLLSLILFSNGQDKKWDEKLSLSEMQNYMLSQKGCFNAKFGLEYLRQVFDTIFHQYSLKYNVHFKDQEGNRTVQNMTTFKNVSFNGIHFKVERIQDLFQKDIPAKIDFQNSKKDQLLAVSLPFHIYSVDLKTETKDSKFSFKGYAQFNFIIEKKAHQNKLVPQLKIELDRNPQFQIDEACQNSQKCIDTRNSLENFLKIFMGFENNQFFDTPSSVRTIQGLIKTFNEMALHHSDRAIVKLDLKTENLDVILGCTDQIIQSIFSYSVQKNQVEIGFANNYLEFLFPYNLDLNFQDIIRRAGTFKNDSQEENFNLKRLIELRINKTDAEDLKKYNLQDLNFNLQLVKDSQTLESSIKLNQLQSPGFEVRPSKYRDLLDQVDLDKVTLRQNFFLQLQGVKKRNKEGKMKGSTDLTIVPIELEFTIHIGFRDSYRTQFGTVPQISFRRIGYENEGNKTVQANLIMKDCLFAENLDLIQDEDEDEDFEEDDDKPQDKSNRKLKLLQESVFLCSLKDKINKKIKEEMVDVYDHFFDRNNYSKQNIWMVIKYVQRQLLMNCHGIQLQGPVRFRFDKTGRFVMNSFIDDKMMPAEQGVDPYCDNNIQELEQIHPKLIQKYHYQRFIANYIRYKDAALFHPLLDFDRTDWYHGQGHFYKDHFQPVISQIINHYPYKQWCKDEHPDLDSLFCAQAYSFTRDQNDYSLIKNVGPLYFHKSNDLTNKPLKVLNQILFLIESIGIFLFILRIDIDKNVIMFSAFFINAIISLFYLTSNIGFGVDTSSYLDQAHQFESGQTNYKLIQSINGQCYYPAGHLWHYLFILKILKFTIYGEQVLRIIHLLMHSIQILLIVKISYKYFKQDQYKAQIVGFLLLTTNNMRILHMNTFNDSFQSFYLVLCIYMFSKSYFYLSAFFLSVSLSIKAGAFLLFPAFLGMVQYQRGTLTLIKIFFLVILVQVVIASPFLLDPVALALGWKLGANTSLMDYLYFTKIITRPGDHGFAALYGLSFFWKFLDEHTYGNLNFPKILKLGIILVNVYYFFIQKLCLNKCLQNLQITLKQKPDKSTKMISWQRKKAIEILVVSYFAGICLMPGIHWQFQLWYVDMIPFLFQLTGLDFLSYLNIFQLYFPIMGFSHMEIHHLILLALVFYTIGIQKIDPKEFIKEMNIFIQKPIKICNQFLLVRSSDHESPFQESPNQFNQDLKKYLKKTGFTFEEEDENVQMKLKKKTEGKNIEILFEASQGSGFNEDDDLQLLNTFKICIQDQKDLSGVIFEAALIDSKLQIIRIQSQNDVQDQQNNAVTQKLKNEYSLDFSSLSSKNQNAVIENLKKVGIDEETAHFVQKLKAQKYLKLRRKIIQNLEKFIQ